MAAEATQSWIDRRTYPFSGHYLAVEGGRMHYIDEGHGDPFVFVHGVPEWSFVWRHLIRGLSRDHRCVAMDHIGFGLSENAPSFPQTAYAHCRNFTQLMDHLGLDDVTLVMHDLGGPIALSWALDHLPRVKRLILFNTWMHDLHGEGAVEKAGKLLNGPLGRFAYVSMNSAPKTALKSAGPVSEEFQRMLCGPFEGKSSRETAWKAAKQMLDGAPLYSEVWNERENLLQIPMQILWGLKDPVLGEHVLNKIWHEFPLAEVECFKDAGTYVMEQKPPAVLNAIQKFVAGKPVGYLA